MSAKDVAAASDGTGNDKMEECKEAGAIEHRRLTNHFHTVISQTAEKYISSGIRFSLFKEKYADLYAQDPEELRQTYEQLKKQLQEYVKSDLEEFCADIVPKLQTLDDIIAKSEGRKGQQAWRPSGNPEADIRSHLYREKVKHRDALVTILQEIRDENKKLEEKVQNNHNNIIAIQKRIDSATGLEGKHYVDMKSSLKSILNQE